MTSILHYPNYTPSRLELRSLLLYYDNVHSIVPLVDQGHVINREHVQEVLQIDSDAFDSIDPSEGYGSWVGDLVEMRAFKSIVDQVREKNDYISQAISKLPNDAYSLNPLDQESLLKNMKKNGWTIVAHQKIPQNWIEFMHDSNAAQNMNTVFNPDTGQIIEENPVLMPKIAADFLLSQLARTISHSRGIPGTSFSDRCTANQLYDPRVDKMQVRADLLTLTLPMIIPDGIESMSLNDYNEVRDLNAQVRKSLNNLLENLAIEQN